MTRHHLVLTSNYCVVRIAVLTRVASMGSDNRLPDGCWLESKVGVYSTVWLEHKSMQKVRLVRLLRYNSVCPAGRPIVAIDNEPHAAAMRIEW